MSKWELQLPANSIDFIISLPDIYELMVVHIVRELWLQVYQKDTTDPLTSLDVKRLLLEGANG